MIRLSLCIATLNRAKFIGVTLESILLQITDEVEVVVVDGASTDGTESVVVGLFAERPNCHYHRLAQKGGVDLDYCHAVDRAVGEFCWLMTDDDIIKPGGIETVLQHLQANRDLVLVNSEVADKRLVTTLTPQRLRVRCNREFAPAEQAELLAVAGDLLSFIGTVVIRRKTWQSRETAPYLGTEFVHVGVVFQRPLERNALVLASPLVRIRYGNAQWTGRAFDIWMFKWPRLIWSFPLPDNAKRRVVAREPYRRFGPLLNMKVLGCFSWQEYRSALHALPLGAYSRILAIALAAFPDTLFNALMSLVALPCCTWGRMARVDLGNSRFSIRRRWRRLVE
jgi:glycosyltransferase involved in cell wall biosynthesis